MSKENSENTPNFKRSRGDAKQESSDSDDLDERPCETFRKVLSENFISPIKTPTKGLSPLSRKSFSPRTDGNKVNDSLASTSNQRQSTSLLNCTNTDYNDDLRLNSISEEVVNTTPPIAGFGNYGSTTVESRPLEAYNSEYVVSNYSIISGESDPIEYSNSVNPLQSASSGHFQDSPMVFVADMQFENEISSNPVEIEHVDLAAGELIYDSSAQDSPKQVPTSAESEDSEDENISFGNLQFENASSMQKFTTPVELMHEIRTVFTLISEYVRKEMHKTRTKLETLEINGSRKRHFLESNNQLSKDVPNNIQRIASRLFSTRTEQEGKELIYDGPSQRLLQTSIRSDTQESSRSSSHGSSGLSSLGSDHGFAQQSSGGAAQSSGGAAQSSGGAAQSSGGAAQSPGGPTQVSSGDERRPTGEFAQGYNCPLPQGNPVFFNKGFSLGLQIGSESYTETISGRALQSRLSQMIQQHPQEFPQDMLDVTSEITSFRFPRINNWISKLNTAELRQVFYAGIFRGFSRAYSARRHSSNTLPSNGFVQGDAQGVSLGFGYPQGSIRGDPQGSFRGFPGGVLRSSLHRFLSFTRRLRGTSRGSHRGSDSGPPPIPSQNFSQTPNQETELETSAQNIDERIQDLLTQSLQDLNMIEALTDLFLKEYSNTVETNYENISNYLLCFEIMREDYRERENWFDLLEREISPNLGHRRNEAFAFLHLQTLNDVFENCISRVQYGALLLKTHENISEVRSISKSIRVLARKAMSFLSWTKERKFH